MKFDVKRKNKQKEQQPNASSLLDFILKKAKK
jgi:hypothetical protein